MKFLERYIAHQAKKPAKHSMLHAYLLSLLSLCLSVTMLLGTTMAWFTSGVEVQNNEIYVGTLAVDLRWNGVSLKSNENAKAESTDVFAIDEGEVWYANRVEARTLTVVDYGEIPFTYKLTLTPGVDAEGKALDMDKDEAAIADEAMLTAFRSLFVVYSRTGGLEEGETITAQELIYDSSWVKIGTLQELYDGHLSVFTGESEKMQPVEDGETEKCAAHTIAIWMNPDALADTEYKMDDFQGYTLNFNIKLVANQVGTPEQVTDEAQLLAALELGCSVQLAEDVELSGSIVLDNQMLNGNGHKLEIPDTLGEAYAITTTGGTIKNLTIWGADYEDSQTIGVANMTGNLYIDTVTIDNAKTALGGTGNGKNKVVVTNSKISGAICVKGIAGLDFVNSTLSETGYAVGSLTVCGNTSFTNCDFGQFKLHADIPDDLQENIVVTFNGCTVGKETVTPENLLAQLGVDGSGDWSKCTFVIDGVSKTIGN